jgi:hypothetical protein
MVGTMTWVTTGEPTVQRQRNHWVVRVAGYDSVADIDAYVAAKSPVLQEVLQASGRFSPSELATIAELNNAPEAG